MVRVKSVPGTANNANCPSDGNVCTDDICDTASDCQYPNNTGACNDGDVCTGNDTCSAGVCLGGATPLEVCDDNLDNDCDGWVDELCAPPIFYTNIDLDIVDNEPIHICFAPDQPLNAAPIATFEAGGGTLKTLDGTVVALGASLAVPAAYDVCHDLPSTHCLDYTGETDGEEVIVRIDEGSPYIVAGIPGSETAGFVVDFLNNRISSFCVYDGEAGGGAMLSSDVQFVCNNIGLEVYFEVGDLINLDPAGCNLITISEIDTDLANIPAPPNPREPVSVLCDISLPPGVQLTAPVTVTLGISRPSHITPEDFMANLQILYYNETPGSEGWVVIARASDGSATVIWDDAAKTTGTATFLTDHFTTFAATSSSSPAADTGGGGDGTQATSGGGGGGCSVAGEVGNISTGSALSNLLVFLLPMIFFFIRKKRNGDKKEGNHL